MAVNILYLIDSLQIGGTEMQLVRLIKSIDRKRFHPHICTFKKPGNLFEGMDVPVEVLDFQSFSHPSILLLAAKLSNYIRKHKIQIVQTFFQDPFLLAAMVKPFSRIKLIGSFRDMGFWCTRIEAFKMSLAYPFFSGFIANSQAVKNHFVQVNGLPPEKIEVIYNGVDTNNISPEVPGRRGGRAHLIGIVANCNREVKRVDDFIQAAALVHHNYPETRFMVVGDGHLRPGLEVLSRSLDLTEALTFVGSVENPLELISRFDVGVITSESEGFCNAILEYMACGVPVVATDSGGNNELVTEGENGFLVPVGDVEMLANRIENLLNNNDLWLKNSQTNRDKINLNFTLSKMVENYQNAYDYFVQT
jgi:glycosyltransferase involved in cell wall biosynthesis